MTQSNKVYLAAMCVILYFPNVHISTKSTTWQGWCHSKQIKAYDIRSLWSSWMTPLLPSIINYVYNIGPMIKMKRVVQVGVSPHGQKATIETLPLLGGTTVFSKMCSFWFFFQFCMLWTIWDDTLIKWVN